MNLIRTILYFVSISTIVSCSISPTCSTFSVSPKMNLEKLKEVPSSIEFEKGTVSFYFNVSNVQKEAIYEYNHTKRFLLDYNSKILLAPYMVIGDLVKINTEMGFQTCDYIKVSFEELSPNDEKKDYSKNFKIKNAFIVSNNKVIEKVDRDIIYDKYSIKIDGIPKDLNISFIVLELIDENGNKRFLKSNSYPVQTPNKEIENFLVDKSDANDWQAKGIDVVEGSIYLSVFDNSSKKGSVIKMNSSDGSSWSDLALRDNGLRYSIDSNVGGIDVSNSTILITGNPSVPVYNLDESKGNIKTIKSFSGRDITVTTDNIFIVYSKIRKFSIDKFEEITIKDIPSTGSICSDKFGNVYSTYYKTIKKMDLTGQVQDLVKSNYFYLIDIAIDNRNGDIYALGESNIIRFNSKGQLITTFSNGAIKASSIAIDELGFVYVADTGNNSKDSKVIKFEPSTNSK